MKVTLQGHIIVPESDLSAVKEALIEHIRLTRQEEGCLRFDVSPDDESPTRFNVYEEFVDRNAFEDHQRRIVGTSWERATINVARHYQVEGLE